MWNTITKEVIAVVFIHTLDWIAMFLSGIPLLSAFINAMQLSRVMTSDRVTKLLG